MAEQVNQETGPKIVYLSPEQRREAQVPAKQVWVESMKLLNGKNHVLATPHATKYLDVEIWANTANKNGAQVDLEIDRTSIIESGRVRNVDIPFLKETFAFHTSDGGYVTKEIVSLQRKGQRIENEKREANKEELEELLGTLRQSRDIEDSMVPSKNY